MNVPDPHPLRLGGMVLGATITGLLMGCTSGPMNIRNVHYYAVKYGENTNFYRLTVSANTHLGVAGYREGWFPATAVDKLFGEVSASSGQSTATAKESLRAAYDDAVTQATRNYLAAAVKPETTKEELARLWEPRMRVLAFPNSYPPVFGGSSEIAFDVNRGVAVPHSDEKLVIVLSSDPDGVIGAIASVAEDEKTAQTINRLGSLVNERSRVEHAAASGRNDSQKQQVFAIRQTMEGMRRPADSATGDPLALKATVNSQVQLLANLLDLAAP